MTIEVEVLSPLAEQLAGEQRGGKLVWQEDLAAGETLGRVLERATYVHPGFAALYAPRTRRLAGHVKLTVNGRNHELVGGLTTLLHDGDKLILFERPPEDEDHHPTTAPTSA